MGDISCQKLSLHCLLIYGFKKPVSQFCVDSHGSTDNGISLRISLICVHLRHLRIIIQGRVLG